MQSAYAKQLQSIVLEHSVASKWSDAIKEWDIVDCEEDEDAESECICGKENLRYLYTVENMLNQHRLYPIGSSCIKKFNRADLNEKTKIQESMFKLFKALKNNEFISLTKQYFTRKLLLHLHENGAFPPSKYNRGNGYYDYMFMLDMFNKRDKNTISQGQHSKIRGIIIGSLRPYLEKELKRKSNNIK